MSSPNIHGVWTQLFCFNSSGDANHGCIDLCNGYVGGEWTGRTWVCVIDLQVRPSKPWELSQCDSRDGISWFLGVNLVKFPALLMTALQDCLQAPKCCLYNPSFVMSKDMNRREQEKRNIQRKRTYTKQAINMKL